MDNEVNIYPLKNCEFVVSEGGTWLPGVYDSAESAEFAVTLPINALEDVWGLVKPGTLTMQDLQKAGAA